MPLMTRRELITAAVLTAASYSRVMGGNDRLSVGLIGRGTRGIPFDPDRGIIL